jgi:hypothetical protein
VGYVELQRRSEERARGHPGGRAPFRQEADPYFFSTLGFGLATPASWLSFFMLWSGSPLPVVVAPLIPSTVFLVLSVWQLRRERASHTKLGAGGEKQVLLAIRDSGSGLTPVEVALETSLALDEAEEILSRLANRGHLLVESLDGALFYALSGKRPGN